MLGECWCPKRTCMLEDSNKIKFLDNSALKLSKNHGLLVITFMGLIYIGKKEIKKPYWVTQLANF